MKNKSILLIVIITGTLLAFACKKEVYLEVEDIICNLDYSTHPNHQKYQEILDKYAKKGIVGMSVVISTPNDGDWVGSAGYASIEDNVKMNNCHLHHTASIAKSFIGVVILQLIEESKLSFDAKIAPYLSDKIKSYTPNVNDLTIKHLMQHTSGIPDIFDVEFLSYLMNNPRKIYTTEELLKLNENKNALYAPGAKHTYADPNFMLLSIIIDQIEGNHSLSLKNRIFEPLGLDMHYHNDNYPFIKGLVASYWEQYNNGMVENVSDLQNRIASYILGADGVISNAIDMAGFYRQVFEGGLLNEDMLKIVTTECVEEDHEYMMNTGYSHGFMIIEEDDGKWIGHAGSHIGASCYVYYNLDSGITIGVFTNTGTFLFLEKMELIFYSLWNDLREVAKLDN